ncbi:MAG: DUF721 domain-containing protein [Candidatus Omnitrophica bacterium]|nr:DUF721 domain-containing protein [Candidatus Omnitrophota bacterium]
MEEKPLKPILESLFTHWSTPEQERKSALAKGWPKIAGPRFSEHTKPRIGPNGRVTVWVDDSTLAFELSQRYKPTLLKRLKNQLGEDQVKDIRFYVGEIR